MLKLTRMPERASHNSPGSKSRRSTFCAKTERPGKVWENESSPVRHTRQAKRSCLFIRCCIVSFSLRCTFPFRIFLLIDRTQQCRHRYLYRYRSLSLKQSRSIHQNNLVGHVLSPWLHYDPENIVKITEPDVLPKL
jgi:hypothetical protein